MNTFNSEIPDLCLDKKEILIKKLHNIIIDMFNNRSFSTSL